MLNNKELNYKQLKSFCNPDDFDFKSTKDIKETNTVIG